MNINGVEITSLEELEAVIVGFSEESKDHLRSVFNQSEPPTQTQKQKDYQKYLKRASVRDQIVAEMAAENMERVRAGTWTVTDLINLTQDTELKAVLSDLSTLSFELAQSKLLAATNPLLTTDIKNGWLAKLQAHLYNG